MNTSMKVFGTYLAVVGICFATVPNLLLPVFGFEPAGDFWIRLFGLSLFLISWVYYIAIRDHWLSFYKLSALARFTAALFLAGCALIGFAPWQLFIFAFVDFAGAAWTYLAIRHHERGERIASTLISHSAGEAIS